MKKVERDLFVEGRSMSEKKNSGSVQSGCVHHGIQMRLFFEAVVGAFRRNAASS